LEKVAGKNARATPGQNPVNSARAADSCSVQEAAKMIEHGHELVSCK
jgi:hypothetical protein